MRLAVEKLSSVSTSPLNFFSASAMANGQALSSAKYLISERSQTPSFPARLESVSPDRSRHSVGVVTDRTDTPFWSASQ